MLSLSNSHNYVALIQKNRSDKSHRVIVALIIFLVVGNNSEITKSHPKSDHDIEFSMG